MLNEEKIRLMTGIAMYNKKNGKEILPVTRYFKSDYISSHLIRSFLVYTFVFAVGIALWILYQIEDIMNTMEFTVLLSSARYIVVFYVSGLLLYLLVTYVVYSRRYDMGSKSLKVFQAKLRRLERRYSAQAGQKENEEGRPS